MLSFDGVVVTAIIFVAVVVVVDDDDVLLQPLLFVSTSLHILFLLRISTPR